MDTATKVVRTPGLKPAHPGRNLMLMAVFLVILGGVYFYYVKSQPAVPSFWIFKDEINQIQISLPQRWRPIPSVGFIKVFSNPENPQDTSVLITKKPIREAVEYFGLADENASKIQIGDKSLSIGRFEEPILGEDGEPAGTATFTRLYFIDTDGTDYLFEVSPEQKDGLDPGIEEIISSLRTI